MRKYINWLQNAPKQFYALVMIAAMSAALPVALNALGPANNTDAAFTIDKKVRVAGTAEWKDSTTAKPGDTVEYQVTYTNKSKIRQLNVALRDKMGKGLRYVANSSVLNGTKLSDKLMESGVNLGHHDSGGNAVVYYKAVIPNKENLSCGTTVLKNTATINVGNTPKSDEATVTVENECAQAPIYKCNSLTIEKVSQDDFKFSVQYTASNGAVFKKVVYKVYDANNNEVYSSDKGNFNGFKPGKYTAKAFITVAVDGSEKTVTSETCEKQFVIDGQNTPKKSSVKIDKLVENAEQKAVGINKDFTYQIKVTNNGETNLKNVAVTDNAPSGITFTKASAGALKDNKWNYTIAELQPGQSVSFTITAKAPAAVNGAVKNTACADIPETAANAPDSCDSATVTVEAANNNQKPTEPNDNKNPSKPSKPTEPEKPSAPTNPNPKAPSNPINPSTPTTPSNPTPTTPSKPSAPTSPSPSPTQPSSPTTPSPSTTNTESTVKNPSAEPAALPKTGMNDPLVGGLGLGALMTAGLAYAISRRRI